jgi:N-acetylglucosamine-6-phosphate deacetylase
MRTYLTGGKIITPEVAISGKTLVIEENLILGIESGEFNPVAGDKVIDVSGDWIVPGMIDLHVHGAFGYDTMDATPEAVSAMALFFARHGVTSFLPTTLSASPDSITKAVRNIANYQTQNDGAQCLGVHLEGPYLNPAYRGAQPEHQLRDADPSEYEDWLRSGVVKLVSIAPERSGAIAFIQQGVKQGIEFAVGHSGATYAQVIEAADCGLRQATHTFNGMAGLHHREPGTLGAVLTDDRIYAQVIADGVHAHPAAVSLLVRVKGQERTILVTDAIRATGLEDGDYALGDGLIFVENGISRTNSGGLAGSTLMMDKAIRNIIAFTGISFQEAIYMATTTPALAMGIYGEKGVIRPGADADIAVFDKDAQVRMTMVSGRVVYQRPE